MAKEDKVQAFVDSVAAAEKQVLVDEGGKLYDGAFGEGVASVPAGGPGGFTQEQMDQAKLDAAAAQAGIDAAQLQAAVDAAKADHDAMQAALDAIVAGKQAAESVVKDLQDKLTAAKASFEAVFAFLPVAPAPGGDVATPEPVQPQSLAKPKFDPKND
jgi:hypothetical protein